MGLKPVKESIRSVQHVCQSLYLSLLLSYTHTHQTLGASVLRSVKLVIPTSDKRKKKEGNRPLISEFLLGNLKSAEPKVWEVTSCHIIIPVNCTISIIDRIV